MPNSKADFVAKSNKRKEKSESLDFFPTPPWATRALFEHVLHIKSGAANRAKSDYQSAADLACGQGHMAEVLKEYFYQVGASDIFDYGYGSVKDFLGNPPIAPCSWDWLIFNPPFVKATEFILRALPICRFGCAFLVRTAFLEGQERGEFLFKRNPPAKVAIFSERVPMVWGKLDPEVSPMTSFAWMVWRKDFLGKTELLWIPPCKEKLQRPGDYLERRLREGRKVEESRREVPRFF